LAYRVKLLHYRKKNAAKVIYYIFRTSNSSQESIMKNTQRTIQPRHQCLIFGALLLSSLSACALSDEMTLSQEKLLQQFNLTKKIKPTLYFENSSLRLFSENSTELIREKSELLDALDIFDKNFGASPKMDIALMNSQMSLIQLDTSKISERFLSFMSYQGIAQSPKMGSINTNKVEKFNILAHEACHKLLINQVEEKGLKSKRGNELTYGHAILPDWFDEMAAIMCENQALSEMRLSNNIDTFIPFEKFLDMENPAFTSIKKQMNRLVKQQRALSNDKKQTTVMAVTLDEADNEQALLFYQQAALFRHFLQNKFGVKIFKQLTQKFVEGADVNKWLLQELSLKQLAQLDTEFKNFYQAVEKHTL